MANVIIFAVASCGIAAVAIVQQLAIDKLDKRLDRVERELFSIAMKDRVRNLEAMEP